MQSIWNNKECLGDRQELIGSLNTDVLIIGAGMAGILTAYYLNDRGLDVVVVEKNGIAQGVTGNTTAKITSQHGLIYDKLIEKQGKDIAEKYGKANEEAINAYEKIINDRNINCHFKRLSSYLYSTSDTSALKNEADAACSIGIKVEFTDKTELPFEVKGAVRFDNQAQFNPLEFIKGLADDITIYENTKVIGVKRHTAYTDMGTITAKHIVFCTHYPFINVPGLFFLRQHQERSYVLALKNVPELNGMYYGIDEDGLSFRSAKGCMLLGGGSHRTGQVVDSQVYSNLIIKAKEYYPKAEEITFWSAQDCVTHDNIPFIGRYSYLRPYWYVATGFKKWGMTSSMIAAMIISDIICGRSNPYVEVFTPQRIRLKASIVNTLKDIGVSIKNLSKGYFHLPLKELKDLPEGQAKIVRIGLKRYGVYKDENKKIHKISVKCPHLGCELQWNPNELSWDCPCHGSRLDYDGKILDGPAQ